MILLAGWHPWMGWGGWFVLLLALVRWWRERKRPTEKIEPEEETCELAAEPPSETVTVLPIEDFIDLHGFSPREVVQVAEEYLNAAAQAGFREVRLIHGRGIGFQRARIRGMLEGHSLVQEFADAPPQRGGWGATVVILKGAAPPVA